VVPFCSGADRSPHACPQGKFAFFVLCTTRPTLAVAGLLLYPYTRASVKTFRGMTDTHEIATGMAPKSHSQTSTTDLTIDSPQAISIVVFPRRQTWRCSVAEINLRQILRELKTQRRHMDRAIAALEVVVDGKQRYGGKGVKTRRVRPGSPESANEAIDGRDIENNGQQQRQSYLGIVGAVINSPVLEASGSPTKMQVGRFGWKSHHSSLQSSCADSLRNELGMRNRLYPDEYPTHAATDSPTPFDTPDAKTHKTELERLVDEIRHTSPPARDPELAKSPEAQAGEKLFAQVGCAICHVPTYKTLPPGTRINGGTYKIPKFLGNKVIHPYSDFLLHDVGTGDGIPQAAKPEYMDQSTANKFRSARFGASDSATT